MAVVTKEIRIEGTREHIMKTPIEILSTAQETIQYYRTYNLCLNKKYGIFLSLNKTTKSLKNNQ